MVKSIDRLGRNYDEILEQWSTIPPRCQPAIKVDLLQMAQIDAVLPQIVLTHSFDDLVERHSKGIFILW